jgi:hypothetical protein
MNRSSKEKLNKETSELNSTIDGLADIYRIFHSTAEEWFHC